jgi:hypothetical protein
MNRHNQALGVPLVGIPKTIDNDLQATDLTFGFDTALQTESSRMQSTKNPKPIPCSAQSDEILPLAEKSLPGLWLRPQGRLVLAP